MIRTEFLEGAILTIAHRLHTVIDSVDRILVLENGSL
jgi:ABC-type multidrug transport system fused ATPase/permease subunit